MRTKKISSVLMFIYTDKFFFVTWSHFPARGNVKAIHTKC